MSRKKMTRRDFLVYAGVGAAGTLAACAAPATQAPTSAPTQAPAQPTAVPPTAVPPTAVPPTSAPAAPTAAATAAAETAKTGGTLLLTGPTTDLIWDPEFNDAPSGQSYYLYDRLFDYTGPDISMAAPSLVESFQEDDMTITMKIRQGVMFHSGRELTADDVVQTWKRAINKDLGLQITDTFNKITNAEALDKYTVKMTWPTIYPLKREDLTKLFIMAPEGFADIKTKPAGSGPWKLGNYQPGNGVTFVKNPDYWKKPYPYMDSLSMKFIDDPQSRLANLQAGQVDMNSNVPYSDVARLQKEGKLQFVQGLPGGTWYIFALQLKHPPFDNKMVRQAMNYACDRKTIAKLAFSDLEQPIAARYAPGQFWYSEKADHYYTYDLDKAKALLQQAGFQNGFETNILLSEVVLPGTRAACQIYAQSLEQIGVKATLDDVASDIYYARYPKFDFSIICIGTGDGRNDPSPSLNESSFYRATNNRCQIETQPFYDQYVGLIKDLSSTVDQNKRKQIFEQIALMWEDESWAVNFATWGGYYALTPRVHNFKVPPDTRTQYLDTWLAS